MRTKPEPLIPFTSTCVWAGDHYKSFGIRRGLASMYGHKEVDITDVDLQIHEDQTPATDNIGKVMEADYWGWFDNEVQKFTLIWPKYFLLNMCFTYGIKAAEVTNTGKAYRLKIVEK